MIRSMSAAKNTTSIMRRAAREHLLLERKDGMSSGAIQPFVSRTVFRALELDAEAWQKAGISSTKVKASAAVLASALHTRNVWLKMV